MWSFASKEVVYSVVRDSVNALEMLPLMVVLTSVFTAGVENSAEIPRP